MRKITIEDKDFPQTLKDIENPPMQLYCEGNISLLKQNRVNYELDGGKIIFTYWSVYDEV